MAGARSGSGIRKDVRELLDKVGKTPGWSVVWLGNDHPQVVNPTGKRWTMPGTPGHQNAIHQVNDKLRDLGWDPMAQKAKAEAKRKAILVEVREEEERRLAAAVAVMEEKAQAERERLRGSRPPGSLMPGTKDEYIPFKRIVKVVTPWEAKIKLKHLETSACNRRREKRGNTAEIAGAMERHSYQFNPQSIVYDEHGCLVQGAHRYRALAKADPEKLQWRTADGQPGVLFEIVINAPAELNSIYDTGVPRSAGDILTIYGVSGYEFAIASATRVLLCYDAACAAIAARQEPIPPRDWRRQPYGKDEIRDAFLGPYKGLAGAPVDDMRLFISKKSLGMTASAALTFAFLVRRDLPELLAEYDKGVNEKGERYTSTRWVDFYLPCLTGAFPKEGDPRLAFRDWMRKPDNRKTPHSGVVQLGIALKTMVKWLNGEPAQLAKFSITENMPVLRMPE